MAVLDDIAVVGAPQIGFGSGVVFVYEMQPDGWWVEIQMLSASDGDVDDAFGIHVALDTDICVIGAARDDDLGEFSGSAYVFERQPGGRLGWV